MKRQWIFTVLAVVLLGGSVAGAQTDVEKLLGDMSKKTQRCLAALSFRVEGIPGPSLIGQAICIHKDSNNIGTFITFRVNPGIKPERVKDIRLLVPGAKGKSIAGEFLSAEPSSNVGFIRATEPYDWTPVQFRKGPVSIGQTVVSVGLMPVQAGHAPYYALAHVSSVVHVPEKLVRVTGGRLTRVGSPVFDTSGRAIGIVGRQLPTSFVLEDGRTSAPVALTGQQDTLFFLPTEEFAYALEDPPKLGEWRRLAWTGVISYDSSRADPQLSQDRPAVVVGKVIPGHPADKAGLKNSDAIIALNGKPLERFALPELTQRDFLRRVSRFKPGEKITITVLRGDKTLDLVLTLGEMPLRPFEAEQYANMKLRLAVRDKVDLDKYLPANPLPDMNGVVVIAAPPGSAAAAGGLQVGDLITAVNQQRVETVATFKQVIEDALVKAPVDPISFMVRRGKMDTAVTVMPPG